MTGTITIPAAAWTSAPRTPAAARHALVEFWRHAEGEPPVSLATVTTIATATGYSVRQVARAVDALQKAALVCPPRRGLVGWMLVDPSVEVPAVELDGERVVSWEVAEHLRRQLGGTRRAMKRAMEDAERLTAAGDASSARYKRRTAIVMADAIHAFECTKTPATCQRCADGAKRAATGAIASDAAEFDASVNEARLFRRAAKAVNASTRRGASPEGRMLRKVALNVVAMLADGDFERAANALEQVERRL